MQFSTVALFAAATAVVSAAETVTQTNQHTEVVTVIDSVCQSLGTACPNHSTSIPPPIVPTSSANATAHNVSTYEAGAGRPFAVGAVALVAGALLAL